MGSSQEVIAIVLWFCVSWEQKQTNVSEVFFCQRSSPPPPPFCSLLVTTIGCLGCIFWAFSLLILMIHAKEWQPSERVGGFTLLSQHAYHRSFWPLYCIDEKAFLISVHSVISEVEKYCQMLIDVLLPSPPRDLAGHSCHTFFLQVVSFFIIWKCSMAIRNSSTLSVIHVALFFFLILRLVLFLLDCGFLTFLSHRSFFILILRWWNWSIFCCFLVLCNHQ